MVIKMNKNDLWLLFAKTGKIEYYLKYKDYDGQKEVLNNAEKN